ncbi:MAG: hypothetical protein JXB48_20965, partial [Candidatus Latescibacteria bacterium]|nr:hypothetical protein [Candidatus Latescibacterota bacterium]
MITAELLSGFNRIAYEVMHYLLSVLWQSTILISAVGLLSFLLCRKNVKIRHGLLVGVMLIIPVLPLLSSLAGQSGVHRKEIAVLPAYSISPRQIIPPTTEPLRDKPQAQELLLSNTIIPAKAPAHEHISILDYPWLCVLLAYLVVAVYFLLKILSARVRIRHWIASGNAVIDEHTIDLFSGLKSQFRIMREVYIVESPCVTVPFTIRTFQPVILLPEGFAEQLSENELKATAIHELSHVKCNDALTATLISLIRTFFFFHPLIWIAAKQISYLAELVCDNAVMELSSDSASYAGLLSRIAENIPRRLPTEYAAGIIFSGSVFYRRMKVLLSEKGIQIQRLSRLALTGTAVGIFLSLAIALAVPLAEKGTQSMITISGKVIVDDKPVAGAKIFVFYQSERKFEQKSVTDKNGMFTVSISESLLTGERWNRLAIIARHDKYSFGWKYLTDEEKNDTISINLFKPETITGTIKDESGNPIKNADINVLHIGYSSGMDVFDTNLLFLGGKYNEFGTGTDQNGNFTLDMVPEGSTVALYCVAPGFAYVWKSPVTAGTEGIPIVLKPEGRIEGSVVSSLPDISVKNISIGAQGILYSWWGETTTDENGTYILKNLPEDYYNVFVLDDLPDCTAAAQESVKVGPGTTIKNVDLILIEGGFITGKIIDTETGQGFITDEHADVAIYGPSRPKSGAAVQTSKIQPDGSYKIRAAPGKNYIYKMQLGFPWTLEDIQGDNYHWVDVKNGETISEVNFYVKKDKEKKVTVKVTTPDGSPAKNILIQSLSEGGFIEFPSLGRTDKDGIVEINRFRVKMNKTIMAVD